MAQDIRELLKQDKQIPSERLREGHQQRFMDRLENELPKKIKKRDYSWLKIAASVVVILSIAAMTFNQFQGKNGTTDIVGIDGMDVENATVTLTKVSSPLAKVSPDYQKMENSILTSIKFGLSQITVDEENRELVESFMLRLENLDKEYQNLAKELIEVGPNMQSVEAMTDNLTMRLTLLNRLKDKLKELKRIEDESYDEIQA